jgi:hypothetical protein
MCSVHWTGQLISKDGNSPMAEKKSWTEILKRLPEKYSEFVSVFKDQAKTLFLLFSLKGKTKNLKSICACTESSVLI